MTRRQLLLAPFAAAAAPLLGHTTTKGLHPPDDGVSFNLHSAWFEFTYAPKMLTGVEINGIHYAPETPLFTDEPATLLLYLDERDPSIRIFNNGLASWHKLSLDHQ